MRNARGFFRSVAIYVIWSALCASSFADSPDIFHKPVRLQADGKDIDVGGVWGHAGPCLSDVDGDGLTDLVVGNYSGRFQLFRNVGTPSRPRYAAPKLIMGGDTYAQVWIYCCIGSSPCFADFDGDNVLDLLSGSYDPGACYWFRGLGGGKFAARETILDAAGKPILMHPHQKTHAESFGSWPAVVDWDHDGDLDLLIGAFDGTMFVRLNEGSRNKPQFATETIVVQAAGETLQLPGTNHAAVVVADWDADGRWDLLSGSGSGAVFFFRNTGELSQPTFAAPQVLVPAHVGGRGYEEIREADQEPTPGIRTQIAVGDYNNDGKLDLLTGDFCTTLTLKAGLSQADRDAMQVTMREVKQESESQNGLVGALKDDFVRRFPGDAIGGKQANDEFASALAALYDTDKYKQADARIEALNQTLLKYLEKPTIPDSINKLASCHGYVWLYLRK